MFDVELIRQDRESVEDMLRRRKVQAPLDKILSLDDRRLTLVRKINQMREQRNKITESIPKCSDATEKKALIESNRKLRQSILEL
ncbi:MAG TPA: hypothetical protein PLK53_06750, partial [Bacillota bacterium]|nr:hypothetical protein [Bacillota bacterium]